MQDKTIRKKYFQTAYRLSDKSLFCEGNNGFLHENFFTRYQQMAFPLLF